MSLDHGYTWVHKDIKLVGYSLAGTTTSIAFPSADVVFDVAQGLPFQIPIKHLLITHGHMDHASGLPYLIGQKTMRNLPTPQIYMPEPLVQPMRDVLRLWSQIEDHTFRFQIEGIAPGEERPLKGKYFFKPFATHHRVASQGYTVFERKKRLKPEYQGLDRHALGDLRRQGKEIEEKFDQALVSFTGDTRIEFLESAHVLESRVLIMEVTYWDAAKSVATAREWGHIHFDELLVNLDRIKSEKIVIIHTSARYSVKQLHAILEARVPEPHRARIELFPRP